MGIGNYKAFLSDTEFGFPKPYISPALTVEYIKKDNRLALEDDTLSFDEEVDRIYENKYQDSVKVMLYTAMTCGLLMLTLYVLSLV